MNYTYKYLFMSLGLLLGMHAQAWITPFVPLALDAGRAGYQYYETVMNSEKVLSSAQEIMPVQAVLPEVVIEPKEMGKAFFSDKMTVIQGSDSYKKMTLAAIAVTGVTVGGALLTKKPAIIKQVLTAGMPAVKEPLLLTAGPRNNPSYMHLKSAFETVQGYELAVKKQTTSIEVMAQQVSKTMFKCLHEGCSKEYLNRSALTKHAKNHAKTHICIPCNKSFSYAWYLARHNVSQKHLRAMNKLA